MKSFEKNNKQDERKFQSPDKSGPEYRSIQRKGRKKAMSAIVGHRGSDTNQSEPDTKSEKLSTRKKYLICVKKVT